MSWGEKNCEFYGSCGDADPIMCNKNCERYKNKVESQLDVVMKKENPNDYVEECQKHIDEAMMKITNEGPAIGDDQPVKPPPRKEFISIPSARKKKELRKKRKNKK